MLYKDVNGKGKNLKGFINSEIKRQYPITKNDILNLVIDLNVLSSGEFLNKYCR